MKRNKQKELELETQNHLLPLVQTQGGTGSKFMINKYLQNWCLWILIVLIQSCMYSSDSKYGVDFNIEREKIGLPILNENWEHYKIHGAMAEGWINTTKTKNIPHHLRKTVTYNKDSIILREENLYIGHKEFVTIDGIVRECLYISYLFIEGEEPDKCWSCTLWTAKMATDGMISNFQGSYYPTDIHITKTTADSILISWGLLCDD